MEDYRDRGFRDLVVRCAERAGAPLAAASARAARPTQ